MTQDRLFPVSLEEMIACVERELKMRERVYPRRLADGRMSAQQVEREMRHMRAVLDTLRADRGGRG
jgi:hypothetical protein